MANKGSQNKLIGIICLVIGAGLALWGLQKSDGLESQLSSAITGSQSDNVMMLYIGGAVAIVIGIFFLLKK